VSPILLSNEFGDAVDGGGSVGLKSVILLVIATSENLLSKMF